MRVLQEGNLYSPRACATAFPCVVKQGLLFVKPQPLPKTPLSAAATNSGGSSSSGPAVSGSSSSGASGAAVDPFADVPIIPELDEEGWMTQVWAAALLHALSLHERRLLCCCLALPCLACGLLDSITTPLFVAQRQNPAHSGRTPSHLNARD